MLHTRAELVKHILVRLTIDRLASVAGVGCFELDLAGDLPALLVRCAHDAAEDVQGAIAEGIAVREMWERGRNEFKALNTAKCSIQ